MNRKELRIDIRDQRLRGGRLEMSARTTNAKERDRRESAIRALLDEGHTDIIDALRARRLRIDAVEVAHRRGELAQLLPGQKPARADSLALGSKAAAFLQTVDATKAKGTYKQYEIVCRFLCERFGRETPINTIRKAELQAWLHEPKATKKNQPWAPARQHLAKAVIGRLFNIAIEDEQEAAEQEGRDVRFTRNPARKLELASERRPRVEFLRPTEWQALSRRVENLPVHALLALGTLAGLRISECAHLRVGIDLNLDAQQPYLLVQPRGGKYPWATKTKRSVRRVPLCVELHRILARHIELGYSGDRYLLITPGRDRPVHYKVLGQWTKRAFKAAGIDYGRKQDALTHHSCRHSFISYLVQADVSLKKIETLAGTSVPMILKVYGHLIDADLDNAVAIVNAVATSSAMPVKTGTDEKHVA